MADSHRRVIAIDGLRGLAIFFVVLYHAYGATDAYYHPFGTQFAYIYFIRLGWLGVQLFFLVSGYVILMSLEKCTGIFDFLFRRWVRLFPSMLVGSLLMLAFVQSTSLGPSADRTLINLIPGLTFISPALIHAFTGLSIQSMDGQFWTLYVEVTFYFIFGLSFFLLGARPAVAVIFIIFLASMVSSFAVDAGIGGRLFSKVSAAMSWMGFIYFGWFAAGSLFYLATKQHSRSYLGIGVLAGVTTVGLTAKLSHLSYVNDIPTNLTMLAIIVLFATAISNTLLSRILEWRLIVFLGFVSYPLYLIHDNIILGLTKVFADALPGLPLILTPFAPISVVIFISWLLARFVEPTVARLLNSLRRSNRRDQSEAREIAVDQRAGCR
jgi:peptidoglycan/LPS O-acetylase OafA/YrhL